MDTSKTKGEQHKHMRSLIEIKPDEARALVIDAFTKAKCHHLTAGALLGCNAHTFTRWARMLGIKEKLETIAARALELDTKDEERLGRPLTEKLRRHHNKKGGAGCHKNAKLRVKRTKATIAERGYFRKADAPTSRKRKAA